MSLFEKHFTLEEAEAWLPRLRVLLADIQEALTASHEVLGTLRRVLTHRGNGGGIDVPRYFSSDAVLERALGTIQDAGIVLQDATRGLVDFPHVMGEREVFLCWELGEPDRLEWFHEVHAGFAGRQRLPR